MRIPYLIKTLKGDQDEITLTHIVEMSSAIPVGSPQFLMSVPDPNKISTLGAFIQQGWRMHGDSAPYWWANALTDPNKNNPGTGVLQRYWNALDIWGVAWPGLDNTTTNANVAFWDIQAYVLLTSTGKWTRIDNGNGRPIYPLNYYNFANFSLSSAGTAIYDPTYSRMGMNNVPNSADRSAASSDTTKYRIAHNALTDWINVDGSDVAGIFGTAKARMYTINGAAYNGVTKIYCSVGCDLKPELSSSHGVGELAGVDYYPGSGGSSRILMPTDGSIQRISFCTVGGTGFSINITNANDGTWSANNRVYMTYAEIAANLPTLKFNTTL